MLGERYSEIQMVEEAAHAHHSQPAMSHPRHHPILAFAM
jgi:hypothetical protein